MRVWTLAVVALLLAARPCFAQVQPDPTDLDLDGIPGVMPPPENPQPQIPSVLVGTGRLLIDRAHQGDFNVSGFTNFLASQGWLIAEHMAGAITSSVLSGHDILMVPTRSGADLTDPYSASEVAAIQAFLEEEGGLWMLHDNHNPTAFNSLAQAFGVTFLYDYIQDPSNNEGRLFWPTIHLLEAHPITVGVGSYGLYLGDCLSVAPPARVIGRADDDAYSLYCPAGSRPPTLAVWEANGRAVFAGDITTLSPPWWASIRPEEKLLLQNIANWLLGDSPTATAPTTWGAVKSVYR